jgi:hypothetical protein
MEPALRNHQASSGASIWCEGHSIRLSRDAYMDVAGAIVEAVNGFGGVDVDDSANGSSGPGKRRQPDSVVPLPALPRGVSPARAVSSLRPLGG